ncbi:histidine phosphatase family protein [Lysinibacillus sp. NPDC096418]|uniref:histidine phosphatase family protein n=1 Tax=Lysinibacillus sp. NPDC096418 TaxID=3364138 RepID=UPI00380AC42F
MTMFYLVRHGETVWNKEQRLQGWLDSQLTSDGIMHAKKLGEHLKSVKFAAAFCSSSERAKETLSYLVHDKNLPIHYVDDLREINLGNWQGRTIDEVRQHDRYEYEVYTDFPAQFIATHTESFGTVTERAMYALKNIANQYPDDKILLVSHGVTIKCIVNAILGRSIKQLWAPPIIEDTSVTIVDVENDQWRVKEIGSTLHLQ